MQFIDRLVDAGRSAVSHVSTTARNLVSPTDEEPQYVDGITYDLSEMSYAPHAPSSSDEPEHYAHHTQTVQPEHVAHRDSIFTTPLDKPEYSAPVQVQQGPAKNAMRVGGSASLFFTLIGIAVIALVLTGKHKDVMARIRSGVSSTVTAAVDTISSVSIPL